MNGAMAALLWFGFGPEQVDGARYLYTFVLCFSAFMVTFLICSSDLLKRVRDRGRPVPGWLSVSYDAACIAFLVWLGHWVLGLLILWEVMCLAHIYDPDEKEGVAV